jgi:hypothetical protein
MTLAGLCRLKRLQKSGSRPSLPQIGVSGAPWTSVSEGGFRGATALGQGADVFGSVFSSAPLDIGSRWRSELIVGAMAISSDGRIP